MTSVTSFERLSQARLAALQALEQTQAPDGPDPFSELMRQAMIPT